MVAPRKELGQHWLHDRASLEGIVEAAHVSNGDVVLEIGPGKGALTDVLLKAGAEVVALEYDHTLTAMLQKKYANVSSTRIFIQEGDIRSYDFSNLHDPYKIVANIPYYLTANLLRKLVDHPHRPAVAALLVQKEVAERVAARPGDLSLIAVLVQIFYEVSLGEVVSAYLFEPAPKVDSQILVMKRREVPLVKPDELPKIVRLLKAGFAQRRKKLKSSLASSFQIEKGRVEEALKIAGISPAARPQELSIEQWLKLSRTP